jgi:hypothetical protein
MENIELQNTIIQENEKPTTYLDIRNIINILPPHIPEELRNDLITGKEPFIPVFEKDEEFFTDLKSKEKEKGKLTTGIIILNELCTSSLTYSIYNKDDTSEPLEQYPHYFQFLTDTLGLDDTFVGLMQHLEIAMLSGTYIDINDYIATNYPRYGNLYNLAFKIGEDYKLVQVMKNSNEHQNSFERIVTEIFAKKMTLAAYSAEEEKIIVNKALYNQNFVKQLLDSISASTFIRNLKNISHSDEIEPKTKLLISNLLLTLSSFSVVELSRGMKSNNERERMCLTHEAIHYLSQTKEGNKITRVGFSHFDRNKLKGEQ